MPFLYRILIFNSILLFTSWTVISQGNFDYSDIESIAASCYPKDSCNKPRRLAFVNRSCECDSKCHQFRDCCIDVPTPPARNVMNHFMNFECVGYEFDWGVYAISKCPMNYSDNDEIRSKCEDTEDFSHPLAAAPATDIVLNITYKNRYCAHCNDAQSENLRSWDIRIECMVMPNDTEVDAAYIENHLTYEYIEDEHEHFWGFYYPENSSSQYGEPQFYACSAPFRFPGPLSRHVRLCRPNLVSTCAGNWTRDLVRSKCEAYTAVIYISPKLYRNPHCALCNDLNIPSFPRYCNIPTIQQRAKKPAMSFTLLMDVNRKDGNQVGQAQDNQCSSNEQWDPFAKRCRKLGCAIPGHRLQNGVCVPP